MLPPPVLYREHILTKQENIFPTYKIAFSCVSSTLTSQAKLSFTLHAWLAVINVASRSKVKSRPAFILQHGTHAHLC